MKITIWNSTMTAVYRFAGNCSIPSLGLAYSPHVIQMLLAVHSKCASPAHLPVFPSSTCVCREHVSLSEEATAWCLSRRQLAAGTIWRSQNVSPPCPQPPLNFLLFAFDKFLLKVRAVETKAVILQRTQLPDADESQIPDSVASFGLILKV